MGSRSSEGGSKIELMEEEMPMKEDVGNNRVSGRASERVTKRVEREIATSSCSK